MIANLRNYEPETIEFVVPDSIREKFPPVLFQGSTNVDELIKLVNEHFNATFPESEVTQRLLVNLRFPKFVKSIASSKRMRSPNANVNCWKPLNVQRKLRVMHKTG